MICVVLYVAAPLALFPPDNSPVGGEHAK